MTYYYNLVDNRYGKFRLWDWPTDGRDYVVGVDVSEGVVRDRNTINKNRTMAMATDPSLGKDRPDYCAAVILDRESCEHVATWHGYLDPHDFARTLFALSLLYNTALLAVEINGPGYAVLNCLSRELEYPRLYRSRLYGNIRTNDGEPEAGWRTTDPLRAILMSRIHDLRQTGWTTRDHRLVRELSTMQHDDSGKPRAKGRDKDDLVFALAIALQARYESLTRTIVEDTKSRYTGPDARLKEAQHSRSHHGRMRTIYGHGHLLDNLR